MEQQQHRTAWERQLLIRDKNRPTVRDYIPRIFTDFYEMHGDRNFGDDGAIIGGIGRLNGLPVTILAQVKGRNLRLPQGSASGTSGGEIPPPDHLPDRHPRCVLRRRSRGTGTGRGNRQKYRRVHDAENAGDLCGAGRSRQRRCFGTGRVRCSGNAGERVVLCDLSPRSRIDPVERCFPRTGSL